MKIALAILVLLSLFVAAAQEVLFSRRNEAATSLPSDIPGLTVWLEGDDPGYADNSYISNWVAHGSTTYSATNEPGGTTQWPIYSNSIPALNGHSIVHFQTGSPILYSSTITIGDNTIFCVANPPTGNRMMVQIDAVNSHSMLFGNASAITSRRAWGASYDSASATNANGTFRIHHSVINTASNRVYVSGSPGTAETTSAATPKTSGALRLGAYASGQYTLDGGIGLVLIYNRVLTASEQNTVGRYCSNRFNLHWVDVQ